MRVLFTTRCVSAGRPPYDYIGANSLAERRAALPRTYSFGLRFLKVNFPDVRVLEYPTRARWLEVLEEGWDVVGFSFYANEIPDVLEQVDDARAAGVPRLWAGNYGALTPEVAPAFDRVFRGYAEAEVATALGQPLGRLRHPPLIGWVGTPAGLKVRHFGYLFTTRGCSIGCTFCQTPAFAPHATPIPLESIEETLRYYRRLGIHGVMILDETFGLLRRHALDVVELLERYGMHWAAMLRADLLLKHLPRFQQAGFFGGMMGIESLDPSRLASVQKREQVAVVREAFAQLRRRGMVRIGYYMLGFEADTEASIQRDVEALADWELDLTQLCVMTPFPATPLWHDLVRRRGLIDRDWRHWDAKHLVWRHPHLSPVQMRELLHHAMRRLNTTARTARLLRLYRAMDRGAAAGHYLQHLVEANRFDYSVDRLDDYLDFVAAGAPLPDLRGVG